MNQSSMNTANDQMAFAAERELVDVIVSGKADADELASTFSMISSTDFLSPQCALAYSVSLQSFSESGEISKGRIIATLSQTPSPHRAAVMEMLNEAPPHTQASGFDAVTLSKVVKEMSDRRRIESVLTEFDGNDNSSTMSTKVMDTISEIAVSKGAGSQAELLEGKDDFLAFVTGKMMSPTIPIGFSKFDSMLGGGLRPGQFIIIAGRPAHGKSTLGLNIAENVAYGLGGNVMFFSLEMSRDEIFHKVLASESNVLLDSIRSQKIEPGSEDWDKLQDGFAMMESSDGSLVTDDTPNATVATIAASIKARMLRAPVDLVIIDYIQLMTEGKGNVDSRQQEVSAISRNLKLLAKQLSIPVIGMSQLNRNSTQKNGEVRQPVIADLRESGSLEQDADVIFLIGEPKKSGDGEEDFSEDISVPVFLAKQRNGPTGEVRMSPMMAYSKFVPVENGPVEVPDFLAGSGNTLPQPETEQAATAESEVVDPWSEESAPAAIEETEEMPW